MIYGGTCLRMKYGNIVAVVPGKLLSVTMGFYSLVPDTDTGIDPDPSHPVQQTSYETPKTTSPSTYS